MCGLAREARILGRVGVGAGHATQLPAAVVTPREHASVVAQRQGVELAKRAGKYNGRRADETMHKRIIALRSSGRPISETATLAGCSESQVKRVWAKYQQRLVEQQHSPETTTTTTEAAA